MTTTPEQHAQRKATCLACPHVFQHNGKTKCGRKPEICVGLDLRIKWDRLKATCPVNRW